MSAPGRMRPKGDIVLAGQAVPRGKYNRIAYSVIWIPWLIKQDILTKLAAFVFNKGVGMFLSHEKYKEIGVKMIWDWLDILHPRESYTDQYTH